jgi:antitoxin MazE
LTYPLKRYNVYTWIYIKGAIMRLQVSKWGNSLAVRLPVECTRAAGLKDGDSVEASITPAGEIILSPEKTFDKVTFLTRIARLHASMPKSASVVETMRQEERY